MNKINDDVAVAVREQRRCCDDDESAATVWRGRSRRSFVRSGGKLGFHLRPPGFKIRVLKMGKGEKHYAFLLLRRCGEDGGAHLSAMDDSLRSLRLKLMVVLARKKRTRPRQWRLGWRRLNQGGAICFLVGLIVEDELTKKLRTAAAPFKLVVRLRFFYGGPVAERKGKASLPFKNCNLRVL